MTLNTFVIFVPDKRNFMTSRAFFGYRGRRISSNGMKRIAIEAECKNGFQHYDYGQLYIAHFILSLFQNRF
jgi:hypothetical protein